jgi:diguanylate cyclase (GGDEF)-like protein
MPPEAAEEQELMKSLNTRSTIQVPILGGDRIIGFLGFDQIRIRRPWRMDDLELLRVLANVISDAIKKVETEREINELAYFDTLTGLPNRILFNNRLEKAMALAKRNRRFLGVIFIDLDGFKEVNDTLGHNWGDHLLQCIAKRLLGCVRKYDTVARFGGDEFLVMVPQLSRREDLEEIAKKILAVFLQPVIMEEQEVFVNASCGIAIYPEDGETGSMLIKNADLAMYEAKKHGKGQFVFCSEKMKHSLVEKMYMTNSLYRALEKNELFLHYQPQVSANSQEIVGFEALLRWNHKKLGAIAPSEFIPIAEKTGLINSIGEWVLLTACAQNKAWQDAGLAPVQMAVNLSVEQFRTDDLESIVRNCLAETGLDPRYLELEITESIAMKESGDIANCLHKLKDMGVSISIDDFGTEFSSLSRLKDLPVDRIKIDMQFIQGIAVNPKDESIIEVMIHLAKKLGLKVIAEGVETETQLGFLKDEDCDEIQGYYYYKPLSKEAIEKNGFELFK